MASSRCPYGPAQEHPPRAWMPNRSLSSATTKLWCRYRAPWRMRNEMMDSRAAWWLPRTSMPGLAAQRCSTCRHSCSSRAAIRSVPTACLRAKTRPARMDSTMAGVPPSSRATGSSRYWCPMGSTNATVPPPGAVGTVLRTRSRRTTRTPGVCGPPGNLCGDRNTASLWSPAPGRGGGDPDRQVRPGGGVVPERQRPVGVQQGGDRAGVGQDAGHVGGGREAADQQRAARVPVQLAAPGRPGRCGRRRPRR